MTRRVPTTRALVALGLAWSTATAAADRSRVVTFMGEVIGLSQAQIAQVEAGEVVTKQLPAADKPDIAAFGAVHVRVDRTALLQKLRSEVGRSRRGAVLETGRFSRPPHVDDLAPLTLDDDTLAALQECREERCGMKLSRAAMEKIRDEVDWKGTDARSRATQVLKRTLVDYTAAYMKGGTAAMPTYVSKEEPLDTAAEFRKVLSSSPYLIEYAPALHRYATEFPSAAPARAEDLFYWCMDKYGPKPTVSVFHVVIWDDPRRDVAVVASKRIYASHYFRASAELLAVVAAPGGGSYVMDLYRARIDPPAGILSGRILGRIRGGIEHAVGENLRVLAGSPPR